MHIHRRSILATLPAGLADFVARVLRAFEVPGVSIAIVKDGQTVLAKVHRALERSRIAR